MNLEPNKPRRRANSRQAADWRKVLDGFGANLFVINMEAPEWAERVVPHLDALNRLQKARKRAGGKT